MNKYLIIGVAAVFIIAGGWWYFNQSSVPATPETAQQNTNTEAQPVTNSQSSQQTQAANTSDVKITYPTNGDTLSRDQKVTVEWNVSDFLLDSVPSDFNAYVFIYVRKQNDVQGAPNSSSVGDGNPASAGSAVWDIAHARWNSSGTSAVPLDPGTYDMYAHFQVTPKDQSRLCAKSINKECAPDDAAAAVFQRFSNIKSKTITFQIK